jgi:5-methylcytosine-specific restriction endonuclease McrA
MPTPEAKRIAVSKYMKELRSDPERLAAHNVKRRAYYHAKGKHGERAYYDRIRSTDPWGWRVRNLRRNINPEITLDWLRALWDRQDGKCPLSGRTLDIRTAEMDHITPRSRGGTDDLANLRLLSPEANQAKGGMTDDELIALCRDIIGTQIPELIGRAILAAEAA